MIHTARWVRPPSWQHYCNGRACAEEGCAQGCFHEECAPNQGHPVQMAPLHRAQSKRARPHRWLWDKACFALKQIGSKAGTCAHHLLHQEPAPRQLPGACTTATEDIAFSKSAVKLVGTALRRQGVFDSQASSTDKVTAPGPHQCTKEVSLPYCLQPWVRLSKFEPYKAPSKLSKYLQVAGRLTRMSSRHQLGCGSGPVVSLTLHELHSGQHPPIDVRHCCWSDF